MFNMENEVCTAIGTPNKALVLYWGKRNPDLNLPINSSISITLDETLNTKTSVLFSQKMAKDVMYLDGEHQELMAHPERKISILRATLDELRKRAGIKSHALIVTRNSFPKSAGLASSASGAATFVYAASKALGVELDEKEMSIMVRNISGSGCRSVFGGFSAWNKGVKADGEDSYAYQVADENHWPEFIDVIGMVSAAKKKISTDDGHMITARTSSLLKHRCIQADEYTQKISDAIKKKDFDTVAHITMRDSNNTHAVMLDSWPPVMYLQDKSREVMEKVQELNESEGKTIAAYTFDAGPNPHIMTTRKHERKVVELLNSVLGEGKHYVAGQGAGPRLLKDSDSLIDLDKLKPR